MQSDPAMEWRRLTEEYRDMGDEELRNLAEDFDDLTETAQQALHQEMRSRGMGDPKAAGSATEMPTSNLPAAPQPPRALSAAEIPQQEFEPVTGRYGFMGHSPMILPDEPAYPSADDEVEQHDASQPHDYTWKTVLCDCETSEEAQYLVGALRNAGLDGWVQPSREFGRQYSRVLVAADQLEQAKGIAAKPIPQEVIDNSKAEVPEFVVPKCPKCGAEDPVLEAVEPANTWHCEQCDYEWSDPADSAANSPTTNDQPGT